MRTACDHMQEAYPTGVLPYFALEISDTYGQVRGQLDYLRADGGKASSRLPHGELPPLLLGAHLAESHLAHQQHAVLVILDIRGPGDGAEATT